MSDVNECIWYSGDWKKENNVKIPYNGVQIRAKANYSTVTSPPTSQKLVSLTIEVVDYTNSPIGISSVLTLYKKNVWYDIPIPENTEVSPPKPNLDFTVKGMNSNLGVLQLLDTTEGTYLDVQFCSGKFHSEEIIGFIMKINEFYGETQDSIIIVE